MAAEQEQGGSLEEEAEAALRAALDDIFGGGGMAIFQDFTSQAYVDLLHLMPHFSDLPTPEGYEIGRCEIVEGDFVFKVTLLTSQRNVDLFMVIQGDRSKPWKVARLKVPGIRE